MRARLWRYQVVAQTPGHPKSERAITAIITCKGDLGSGAETSERFLDLPHTRGRRLGSERPVLSLMVNRYTDVNRIPTEGRTVLDGERHPSGLMVRSLSATVAQGLPGQRGSGCDAKSILYGRTCGIALVLLRDNKRRHRGVMQ